MAEVYTLRAPEHFNSNNARRSSPLKIKTNQKTNYDKRTPSSNLLKPPSSTSYGKSNHRPSTVSPNKKQKAEMYHLATPNDKTSTSSRQSSSKRDIHQKSKSNGILIHPSSASQKKTTTYMLTTSTEDHFLPEIPRTASPSIRPNKKKQFVSFDTVDHNDKQNHLPAIRYVSLSQSRALESIQRSMNRYRFRRY